MNNYAAKEKKSFRTWLREHRGVICFTIGAVVAGALMYKIGKGKYDSLFSKYKDLEDVLQDTEAYAEAIAERRSKQLVTDILDCAYEEIFCNDDSPESFVSQIVVDAIQKQEYLADIVDPIAVRNKAAALMENAIRKLAAAEQINRNNVVMTAIPEILGMAEDEFGHNCIINGFTVRDVGRLGDTIKTISPNAQDGTEVSFIAAIMDKMPAKPSFGEMLENLHDVPEGVHGDVEIAHF